MMYKNDLFMPWIPKPVQTALFFLLSLPLLAGSSIYTANIGDMYSGLGMLSEILSYAKYASTIGMTAGIGLVLKLKSNFKSKSTIVFTFISLGVLSIIIGNTEQPGVIILCSLLFGFIKIFGLIELVGRIMFIISPNGDRGEFYTVFYPLVLGLGQLAGYYTADLSFKYNWTIPYFFMGAILFVCALFCIVLMQNKRTSKWEPIKNIDWIGVGLFTAAGLILDYLLVFAKYEGWFNASLNLKVALAAFLIIVAIFVHRQLTFKHPFIPLAIFNKRNVITAIILFSLMGMYLATATLQSVFTGVLQYNGSTNALLNIAMVPGIILGGVIAAKWFKRRWLIRYLLFTAYCCFLLYTICFYFLISPVIEIKYLIIPIFLKGLGMALVYIGGGLYFANTLQPLQLMGAYPVVLGVRSFVGTAFFSAILSWALFQIQLDSVVDLAGRMDEMDAWIGNRGDGLQIYPRLKMQATLIALKRIFGYLALGGILVLVYILLHPFYQLHPRRLIFARKRFMGESLEGYRKNRFDDNDITATAASVTT